MKIITNERGYSLVVTMVVFLLFTVLAVSAITVSLSGVTRNLTAEDHVQASELADKGIQYITNQIQHDLEAELGVNGITRSAFITKLDTILNRYKDKVNRLKNSGVTGEYEVYIQKIENTVDENGQVNPLKKKVTFVSKGIVDGKEKEIISEVEIGAQSVLEALKYALGANKTCISNNCIPGEGNLFLHGGVTIKGDLKVDGNLITTNRGYAYLRGEQWIGSVYPSVSPTKNGEKAHLVLGGDVYTFDHRPSYQQHITSSNFYSGYIKKTNRLQDVFYSNEAPVIVTRNPLREDIPISEQKSVFYYDHNTPNISVISGLDIINIMKPNEKVYASYRLCYWWYCLEKYDGNYKFFGNNTFKSFATAGSLTIRNLNNWGFAETKFLEGAYIAGDLTIGNEINSYDSNRYDKIKVDGPIFVDGDVLIKGADAEFNSIMYVDGDVTIEYSRINGLGESGSLIIFSTGDIRIRNNSVNQDQPSNIKGFFYSEKALEMFGVGSNIRIEGGLSAKRIVLNAIRGRARDSYFSGAQQITSNDYFEGAHNQIGKDSRLQIIYDPDIINTYADIKSREPVIKQLDPPKLVNRSVE